jgi:hypothetical protein
MVDVPGLPMLKSKEANVNIKIMNIKTVKETESGYLVNGNTWVPVSEDNRHYREVQEWIAEGNTPEPKDPPEDPDKETIRSLIAKEIEVLAVDSLKTKGVLDGKGKLKKQPKQE